MNVTIIRGLPGSGKSTLARELAARTGAIVLEPDQMLIEDGTYRYTPDRYAAAVERCRMMLDLISGWDGEGANLRPDIIYCDVLPTLREVTAILESINGPFRLEMYTMHADLPDCRNIHDVDPKDLIRLRRIFERVECPGGKARSRGKYFPRTAAAAANNRTHRTYRTYKEDAGTEESARSSSADASEDMDHGSGDHGGE